MGKFGDLYGHQSIMPISSIGHKEKGNLTTNNKILFERRKRETELNEDNFYDF